MHSLDVVPLGGLGEFGMNLMAVSTGETTLVIDAGVMFAGPELPGVDLLIPDLTYLEQLPRRPAALLLTHGHEDHIGAVPYVWPLIDGPVYGTPLTLALVRPKLEEHGIDPGDRLIAVKPRQRVRIGDCEVEFLQGYPQHAGLRGAGDSHARRHHRPYGRLQDRSDADRRPALRRAPIRRARQRRRAGAVRRQHEHRSQRGSPDRSWTCATRSRKSSRPPTGKLIVTAFASSVYRMQILVDLAEQFDRKVAFVGRGMLRNSEAAQRLGYLQAAAQAASFARQRDRQLPADEVLCLTTGSQGEPMSALSRIAIDDHRYVKVAPDDTVVFSARAIPGNERAISQVYNHLARRGADVIYEGIKHVHVSGHGSEEELKLVLSLVRPQYFIPIHGEYRQLSQHARIAERVTARIDPRVKVMLIENGDVLRFDESGGAGRRQGPGRARADRLHGIRRGDRRGAARSTSSV